MKQPDGVYTGRLVDNKRDGRGKLTWHEDDGEHTYEGDWSEGLRNGRGVRTWPDGASYDGEWKDGHADGWGTKRRPDGGWFEGLWRGDGWARGRWHDPGGADVWDAEWVWDVPTQGYQLQGWGVWRRRMVKGDDGRYTDTTAQPGGGPGDVQGGAAAAMVVTVYEGEWSNDKRHGNGTGRAPDTGTIWCGEWDHGAMTGKGRMLIGDQSRYRDPGGSYVGARENDKFHGEGVGVWSNGDRYQGSWENDKEHGIGTKRWARDGSSFTGVWARGVPVKGTMEWPNGDKFTGTFTEEQVAEQPRGGGMRRYLGEGVLALSSLSSNDGNSSMAWSESNQLKGSLRGNTFHRADGGALHRETQKLEEHTREREIERKQWDTERAQLQNLLKKAENKIKELQTKQNEEEECEGMLAVHNGQKQQMPSEALSELSTAFKVATNFRSQLKKAAPLLVSLEASASELKQFLVSVTERNQSLDVHLMDLSTLREALAKAVEDSDARCKQVLGETLTVESSESEIQQCSRNISSLMKKLLGIKPLPPLPSSGNNEEQQGRLSGSPKDIKKLMTLKPWLLLKSLEPPPSTTSGPFSLLLREITDTVLLPTQGGNNFDHCLKVIEQHTVLHKECNTQAALGQRLHKEIEELLSTCHGLNEAHKRKYMVMRGLEGDEQLMAHPDVWSQLSELLPHAQQAVMDIMVAKCTSSTTHGITATATLTQPGCTASSVVTAQQRHSVGHDNQQAQETQQAGTSIRGSTAGTGGGTVLCLVCEERPPDTQFHPCGHCVCCSECGGIVKRCPHCRAPIQNRLLIP
ncbi:MORN motif [Pelomyxa schiedti]|nr:MORN motif [Pelomyxa schiedti]